MSDQTEILDSRRTDRGEVSYSQMPTMSNEKEKGDVSTNGPLTRRKGETNETF